MHKAGFVNIVGNPNVGKSTLMNMLGLLDNPTEGQYWLDGQEVSTFTEDEQTMLRRGGIGFVFQSFNLIDDLTVYRNIELPLVYMRVPAEERKRRVEEVMARMDISHRAKHFPNQLSGGQQQRVAIARAVISNPKVILADEPSGSLDTQNKNELHQLFFDLRDQLGQTFIIVTHDETLASTTDRTIRLRDGRIE